MSNFIEEKTKIFEKQVRCEIIRKEGIGAIGLKHPFPNWDNCTHYDYCPLRKKTPRGERQVDCRNNPKRFRCIAYDFYENYCLNLAQIRTFIIEEMKYYRTKN